MCRSHALWAAAVLGLGLWSGTAAPARATSLTYQVEVNTASLSGTAGNLDFQLNPGGIGASAVTAVVSNFQTDGTLSSIIFSGDATGSLPSPGLTLDNGTGFNDAFQAIKFGSSVSFDVTLSGPGLNPSSSGVGSSFAMSLYDTNNNPLLTTDTNGSVVTAQLSPDGTVQVENFPSALNSAPAAEANLVSATPEPSSVILLALMLPAGVLVLHRRRRPAEQGGGAGT
jgi:hypothetical protein